MGNEAMPQDDLFHEVADHAPVMLWRINSSFECDWANQAWFAFTGGTLAEQTGFGWIDLVHPDDSDRVLEEFGRAFEAREPVTVEFRIRDRQGRYHWLLDSGAPYSRDGKFAGFVGSCVDITARKETEERTRLLGAEMIRLSRAEAVSSLSTAVVHEIGQPLQAIGSYADALVRLVNRPGESDELSECVQGIREAAARAAAILRNCRSAAAGGRAERVRSDVAEVLRSAEPLIRAHPAAPGAMVDWELTSGMEVELSRLEVQQVLINLCANAFEAMVGLPRRHLRVSAAVWGLHAIIAVADSGPGVPLELRKSIFQSLTTTKTEGMGIGLYVCKTIVAAHGGRIWVEQAADGGAIFKFTLPLAH